MNNAQNEQAADVLHRCEGVKRWNESVDSAMLDLIYLLTLAVKYRSV